MQNRFTEKNTQLVFKKTNTIMLAAQTLHQPKLYIVSDENNELIQHNMHANCSQHA